MMAIQAAMSGDDGKDAHEHDLVMPGFRFHPTEEELIEFYLRRKVEGKCFNVELITFLDLYRYDPWELPALAAIGEKEWFFYVPRDRKYRNGDRPNRVTTSGYWKATGADRMIRAENSRPIGLKKTLVFYTGKAPKGVRTSWIMNEYRLPQNETERYQKAEISLCRVHKRSMVSGDQRNLAGTLNYKPSSSRGTSCDKRHSIGHQPSASSFTALGGDAQSLETEAMREVRTGNNSVPALHNHIAYGGKTPTTPLSSTTSIEEDGNILHQSKGTVGASLPTHELLGSTSSLLTTAATIDDLTRLVGYSQGYLHQPNNFLPFPSQPQSLPLHAQANTMPNIADKLWDWNPLPEAGRDYTSLI